VFSVWAFDLNQGSGRKRTGARAEMEKTQLRMEIKRYEGSKDGDEIHVPS
jgi:hypothetical protein